MTWNDDETRDHVARAEALLSSLAALPEEAVREQVADALHAVVELYGQCLARVLEHTAGPARDALVADELVGHLLLVHDLHPEPAEARVRRALGPLHGAELVAIEGSTARVRLTAGGCGSGAARAEEDVRAAVTWAAPEIERVEVTESAPGALIPVDSLFRAGTASGT
ncbi:NifU family protein [Streptomyces triculaminicus]|uniref:NifU family protein n=1 Tax=Streptomyces triculaminicus TaxID=2816232 RepID=UPI0037D1604B